VKEKKIDWEYKTALSFSQGYVFFDLMAHSLFALKYWIVALKTREIMRREPDTLLWFKVWSVTIFQISLIVSTQVFFWFVVGDKVW
jgi:hypothetical protein